MKVVLIGTDHRLQQSIFKDNITNTWLPRDGTRYRKLVAYCIEKLNVKLILEETHPNQEKTAPTIASAKAKENGLVWKTLGLGEINLFDALLDPPLLEALNAHVKPEMLAGIYAMETHKIREEFMYTTIRDSLREHDCVLAIVGYVHLGVLARMFEADQVPVEAFLFTYPLVVDESRS